MSSKWNSFALFCFWQLSFHVKNQSRKKSWKCNGFAIFLLLTTLISREKKNRKKKIVKIPEFLLNWTFFRTIRHQVLHFFDHFPGRFFMCQTKDKGVHILSVHIDTDLDLIMTWFHHVWDHGDQILSFQELQFHKHSFATLTSGTPKCE